jgi:membrane-bound lytic murein transglycosylase A
MFHPETRTGRLSPPVIRPSARTVPFHFLWIVLLAATIVVTSLRMTPLRLEPISFSDIPGWEEDDLGQAFTAFARSCSEIVRAGKGFSRLIKFGGGRADWLAVCADVTSIGPQLSAERARHFFQSRFKPFRVHDPERGQGLFTGYFEPEVLGDLRRHADFTVPLYAKPSDLVAFGAETEKRTGLRYGRYRNDQPHRYFNRREIEEGALAGKGLEIAWLKSWADAFFIHIQGSGRIRLTDGQVMRLAYAAKSGLPYTAIGGILAEKGEIERPAISMQTIRDWMDRHPHKARELMWENESFVFFREVTVEDSSLGPPGAQQVQLTPFRSLAVDRTYWAFGTPLWIETELPFAQPGSSRAFSRLMIAQDTGSAIKGTVRGDVFFGFGDEAARLAGHMKSRGRMIALLPNELADKLNAGPWR